MEQFAYASPKTLKEALGMLGSDWNSSAVLAGGTDLLSLMKDYVMSPKLVVNLKGIKTLHGVKQHGTSVTIGALTTLDDLTSNPIIRSQFPSLIQAAMGVSSPQIRNMGTVGGDICQRPRCWYFRGGQGLFGMQNGKSLVVDGENRYHAIFGGGPAYFVSASSFGPALMALDATIMVAAPSGAVREVKAADFFVAPKDANTREIALAPNEIVTEISIPTGTTNATYEVRHKEGLDWPLATASVSLKMSGKTVTSANIVLGHVAPTPWATQAGQLLAGKTIDAATAESIGDAAVRGATPLSQNEYKVQLAKVAVKRALLTAAGLA